MGKNKSFRAKSSPPAPKKNSVPSTQSTLPSLGGSILGNIATGMTFGAGSSLGHRAVDGVMGSNNESNNTSKNESMQTVDNHFIPCEKLFEIYQNCLKNENNDCTYLNDMMRLKCSI